MKIHHILGDHAALLVFSESLKKYTFNWRTVHIRSKNRIRYIENGISEYIQDFGASKHITKTHRTI